MVSSFFSSIREFEPVFQGVESAIVSTKLKKIEDSVRAGGNSYLTAILQIFQGLKALNFVNKANQAAGRPLFSWAGKSLVCLTPVVLAILKNTEAVPEKIRPILTLFKDHLSNVYQIAVIVSCVSLLFFGQTSFAVSSLVILGIGAMDRNRWLPCELRRLVHQSTEPLLIGTSLFFGDVIDRTLALLSALSWCAELYLSLNKKSLPFDLQQNLTSETVSALLCKPSQIKINKTFVDYNLFPPVPDIDIQFFIEKFDKINWEKHIQTLREKLRRDTRFITYYLTTDNKTDEQIIAIAKDSLQTFIDEVKERRIRQGEPTDYQKLHDYLKIIAKHIEGECDEVAWTDVLFRLAVEGGGYCGPGKFVRP